MSKRALAWENWATKIEADNQGLRNQLTQDAQRISALEKEKGEIEQMIKQIEQEKQALVEQLNQIIYNGNFSGNVSYSGIPQAFSGMISQINQLSEENGYLNQELNDSKASYGLLEAKIIDILKAVINGQGVEQILSIVSDTVPSTN